MAGGSGPRFAPEDPSLPPPWRALVDGSTGYIYYWNTETNITQYEKPVGQQGQPPVPSGPQSVLGFVPKLASEAVRASPSSNDPHSMRPAEKRHLDGGTASHVPHSGRTISATTQQPVSHGSHHADNQGNRYAPPNLSGAVPGYIRAAGDHHTGHSLHPGGQMLSGGGGSFASRSQPVMSGGSLRTGPDMFGSSAATGSTRTGNSESKLATGFPSTAAHTDSRDRLWESNTNRDRPWESGSVREGSWGAFGRESQWGNPKPVHGSLDANIGGGSAGGNMHGPASKHTQMDPYGHSSLQQKFGSIPVHQKQQLQNFEGFNNPVQTRHIVESYQSGSGGHSYRAAEALHKSSANDYASIGGPDLHKRPRLFELERIMDVDSYRRQHEVTVAGDNVPLPFMTFEAANFPSEIYQELLSAGFAAPTPIQAQSWPTALQSRDVVAIARTGSGKTLGYLLPGFLHIIHLRAHTQARPIVLVLAPTRELATQIHDEAVKFGRSSRISSTCVYGGAPKGHQLRELERGVDIVVATPGRLNDFLEMRKVSLAQVSYLVLDEADRMLDMGFEPQIRKIVCQVPIRRQTLMFTATWPREVRKIASDLLTNAVQITIGSSDELTANNAITQYVEMVHPHEKQRRLEQILRSQEHGSKALIFCSTKKMCDQLARSLGRGFGAVAIHGDKSQGERDHVLAQFKAGRSPVLVATDVAARGLDVKDIRVVINYDFPTGVEDYVHRIGRTGRAGATGVAFTFFSEQDSKYARELIKILESSNQVVPAELRDVANRSFQARGRGLRWASGGSAETRGTSMGSRNVASRNLAVAPNDAAGMGQRDSDGGLPNDLSISRREMNWGRSMDSGGWGIDDRDSSQINVDGRNRGAFQEKDDRLGNRLGASGGWGSGLSGRGGLLGGVSGSGHSKDGWDYPRSGGWGGSGESREGHSKDGCEEPGGSGFNSHIKDGWDQPGGAGYVKGTRGKGGWIEPESCAGWVGSRTKVQPKDGWGELGSGGQLGSSGFRNRSKDSWEGRSQGQSKDVWGEVSGGHFNEPGSRGRGWRGGSKGHSKDGWDEPRSGGWGGGSGSKGHTQDGWNEPGNRGSDWNDSGQPNVWGRLGNCGGQSAGVDGGGDGRDGVAHGSRQNKSRDESGFSKGHKIKQFDRNDIWGSARCVDEREEMPKDGNDGWNENSSDKKADNQWGDFPEQLDCSVKGGVEDDSRRPVLQDTHSQAGGSQASPSNRPSRSRSQSPLEGWSPYPKHKVGGDSLHGAILQASELCSSPMPSREMTYCSDVDIHDCKQKGLAHLEDKLDCQPNQLQEPIHEKYELDSRPMDVIGQPDQPASECISMQDCQMQEKAPAKVNAVMKTSGEGHLLSLAMAHALDADVYKADQNILSGTVAAQAGNDSTEYTESFLDEG